MFSIFVFDFRFLCFGFYVSVFRFRFSFSTFGFIKFLPLTIFKNIFYQWPVNNFSPIPFFKKRYLIPVGRDKFSWSVESIIIKKTRRSEFIDFCRFLSFFDFLGHFWSIGKSRRFVIFLTPFFTFWTEIWPIGIYRKTGPTKSTVLGPDPPPGREVEIYRFLSNFHDFGAFNRAGKTVSKIGIYSKPPPKSRFYSNFIEIYRFWGRRFPRVFLSILGGSTFS
jgi:hypothetical protein